MVEKYVPETDSAGYTWSDFVDEFWGIPPIHDKCGTPECCKKCK